jgi:cell division protein ZapA
LKQAVQVTILGQQYMVKSAAPPEEIRKVADFVNDRLEEVATASKTADSLNAAVLALLNVSGSYLRLSEQGPTDQQLEERIRHLLVRLEQACPEPAADGTKKNSQEDIGHDLPSGLRKTDLCSEI